MIYSATFLRAIIIMIVGVILSFSGIALAEKIRTAIPQANLNYLSIFVAYARGFFRDDGLENKTVGMAVKAGAAQATTVDPGGLVFAQKEGLVSLGFLGDLSPMPFQGFVTTERKIRENPGQIKRWLKGAIRGLMFVRERPEE